MTTMNLQLLFFKTSISRNLIFNSIRIDNATISNTRLENNYEVQTAFHMLKEWHRNTSLIWNEQNVILYKLLVAAMLRKAPKLRKSYHSHIIINWFTQNNLRENQIMSKADLNRIAKNSVLSQLNCVSKTPCKRIHGTCTQTHNTASC